MGTFVENKVFIIQNFQKHFFIKSWSPSPIFYSEIFFLERLDQFSTLNDFQNQNFEMFEEVVHNFGKSDGDII